VVERLGDEVLGAGRQRVVSRLGAHVPREHDHGEELIGGERFPQLAEHVESVGARHVQVEHHQIGLELEAGAHGPGGISHAVDGPHSGALQHVLEEHDVHPVIVHHENGGTGQRVTRQRRPQIRRRSGHRLALPAIPILEPSVICSRGPT
jgi:hypothetical protein